MSGIRNVAALTPAAIKPAPFTTEPTKTVNNIEQSSCSPPVCDESGWQQWIIVTPESTWKAEELVMLEGILTAVIESLNQQGLDGHGLISGYRFFRQPGEYLVDRPGHIAVVNHTSQEIILADAAFKRLRGFYIIHELGHVVDQRTGRDLSTTFHTQIGSDLEKRATADGFWLNLHAENDLEEATADAFALWIMATYAPGYQPIFAYMPLAVDYAGIKAALDVALEVLTVNTSASEAIFYANGRGMGC